MLSSTAPKYASLLLIARFAVAQYGYAPDLYGLQDFQARDAELSLDIETFLYGRDDSDLDELVIRHPVQDDYSEYNLLRRTLAELDPLHLDTIYARHAALDIEADIENYLQARGFSDQVRGLRDQARGMRDQAKAMFNKIIHPNRNTGTSSGAGAAQGGKGSSTPAAGAVQQNRNQALSRPQGNNPNSGPGNQQSRFSTDSSSRPSTGTGNQQSWFLSDSGSGASSGPGSRQSRFPTDSSGASSGPGSQQSRLSASSSDNNVATGRAGAGAGAGSSAGGRASTGGRAGAGTGRS